VRKGTDVEVLEDGGFTVKVKYGKKGEAKLKVDLQKKWHGEYSLAQVTVAWEDGTGIEPKKQEPHEWDFTLNLP